MSSGDTQYIWQAEDWPKWRFELATLAGPMAEVRATTRVAPKGSFLPEGGRPFLFMSPRASLLDTI